MQIRMPKNTHNSRLGRPPGNPTQVRQTRVVVLVCPPEGKELRRAARKEGEESLSAWARSVLLEAARR
jgi:hypothetical protein